MVRVPEADLRLLAGDQLYAIGLARLVALGDTLAVAELADTITLSALAQGAGERTLADAVWAAGARAVGWGPSDAHGRAKDLVLRGRPRCDRGDAHKRPAVPGVALNRASILFAPGVRQARKAQVQVHARPRRSRGPSRARRSRGEGS